MDRRSQVAERLFPSIQIFFFAVVLHFYNGLLCKARQHYDDHSTYWNMLLSSIHNCGRMRHLKNLPIDALFFSLCATYCSFKTYKMINYHRVVVFSIYISLPCVLSSLGSQRCHSYKASSGLQIGMQNDCGCHSKYEASFIPFICILDRSIECNNVL